MAVPVIQVWCVLVDHDFQRISGDAFFVRVPSDGFVNEMQEEIKQKTSPNLDHVADHCLNVWKLRNPRPVEEIECKEYLANLKRLDKVPVNEGEGDDAAWRVRSSKKISLHFSELQPSEEVMIQVLVQVPDPARASVLGKTSRAVDDLDTVQDSKLVKTSPSEMGKLSNYRSLQRQQIGKMLDDRPEPDSVPPVALLYDGFGHFMDVFNRHHRWDRRDLDTKRQDLEMAVDSFAEKMTNFYNKDVDRREEGLRALNEILSLCDGGGKKLMPAAIGTVHSDGHYNGPHDAASCVVEFKNEFVDISSMPLVELTAYIAHSHGLAMRRSKQLFSRWRVPCLGLTIVGPCITFYAMVFLHQWRVVNLTPTLSCVTSACDGGDRKALYAAFYGALGLLDRIDEDAGRFVREPPPTIEPAERKFPYISALPEYGASDKYIQFRILRPHPDTQDYRLLYIAKTLDNKQIIVKFTRWYSIALHAFCAERGRAPDILGFGQLSGGWSAVAMDYISSAVHPSQSPSLSRLCDKWTSDLQGLMESFHACNLVHGDLREPNILCDGEKVMLIDFDWGGKAGKVYYPSARLCPELMRGRDGVNPKITKDDDRRVLKNTFKELKEVALAAAKAPYPSSSKRAIPSPPEAGSSSSKRTSPSPPEPGSSSSKRPPAPSTRRSKRLARRK